jgi:hypothetical protein
MPSPSIAAIAALPTRESPGVQDSGSISLKRKQTIQPAMRRTHTGRIILAFRSDGRESKKLIVAEVLVVSDASLLLTLGDRYSPVNVYHCARSSLMCTENGQVFPSILFLKSEEARSICHVAIALRCFDLAIITTDSGQISSIGVQSVHHIPNGLVAMISA